KGNVRFQGGRLSRSLEVTPILAASSGQEQLFVPPRLDGFLPTPLTNWKIDVSIANDTPIFFSGNAGAGEILPNLRMVGTLGGPIPVGQIELKNARAFLPFTTMLIPRGHIEFLEASPWMPLLDFRGMARALNYEVEAYAFGSLDERRLILRSDPPLPQEALIQLLTTGMAPAVYSESAFGHASVSSSLGSARAFGQKLSVAASAVDPSMSALQFNPASAYPAGRATLHRRFELWRGLSLMKESDDLNHPEGRASFRLRLR
ncbi:MAG TPA: translocation/assembly module TamB domain-containing protein, partial [Terrimicrobiaceae bacterium]